MPKALPAHPHIDWLKKTAKQRLQQLRANDPAARLHQAQLAIARDYGFKSWRALKTRVDGLDGGRPEHKRVFDAARAGDVETVRRAFEAGFDPGATDEDGRTIHQIAKADRHEAIELLVRDLHGREARPRELVQTIDGILDAAWQGEAETLRRRLDAHPELIDALGGGFKKPVRPAPAACRNQHACSAAAASNGAPTSDRARFSGQRHPLHVAAAVADLATVKLLVEAGSDVVGEGDDYEVGVLGWATCFRRVREDVAAYLLDHGARLNIWCAIALDRADDVRALIARDPSLLDARMTRNQHRRTPLHHAAAKNRPSDCAAAARSRADPNATDATGATPLTTASQENAGRISSRCSQKPAPGSIS